MHLFYVDCQYFWKNIRLVIIYFYRKEVTCPNICFRVKYFFSFYIFIMIGFDNPDCILDHTSFPNHAVGACDWIYWDNFWFIFPFFILLYLVYFIIFFNFLFFSLIFNFFLLPGHSLYLNSSFSPFYISVSLSFTSSSLSFSLSLTQSLQGGSLNIANVYLNILHANVIRTILYVLRPETKLLLLIYFISLPRHLRSVHITPQIYYRANKWVWTPKSG